MAVLLGGGAVSYERGTPEPRRDRLDSPRIGEAGGVLSGEEGEAL